MTGSIQEKSNRERVWTTIMELHSQGQIVTRQRVQELSKLSFHIVDGHITNLIERDGTLRRVMNGVFEPVAAFVETRAITVTDHPDGTTKLEIGDEVIQLTPNEVRMLAKRLQGDAQTASNLQMQQDIGYLSHEVQQQINKQNQEQRALIDQLRAEVRRLTRPVASPQKELSLT
ncbi:MAG: hypothetical protein RSB86_17215 [Comamonas sp.]|uniref:hypothetical protein n=1 Tax=Comamonas sp. TaxID=34028 RepID=UPI002FCA7EDB